MPMRGGDTVLTPLLNTRPNIASADDERVILHHAHERRRYGADSP
eukprot:CAMPEP_0113719348 /NCGR_PEP_ID=MMETSP0038_2-20120614/35745_1 /TAXON_ID=2898 /ORGANISM="Cryptomonas paramecium" /LENGTH=44 /DNA_ID=CAMNT_0000647671 /DNA_START=20 /DNA_END=151 /DNA_ORIENTATION=- /assembly_acc=CAM_ASM_000170